MNRAVDLADTTARTEAVRPSNTWAAVRSALFWIHLVSGVGAGLVVGVMSATGAALAFAPQLLAWAESSSATPAASAAAWPEPAALGGATAVTLFRDRTRPPLVAQGREARLYDAATASLEPGRLRSALGTVEALHRSLAAGAGGRAVTGAANLLFVLMCLTGVVLWWPRRLAWGAFRAVLVPRAGLTGKARDFNWHHVAGIWAAAVLLVVSGTGVVISYGWASALVFKAVGEAPPVRQGPPGAPGAGDTPGRAAPAAKGLGAGEQAQAEPSAARGAASALAGGDPTAALPPVSSLRAALDAAYPRWVSASVPLSGTAGPLDVTLVDGAEALPWARHVLSVDRGDGHVLRDRAYADGSKGQRLRGLLRFLHTGEAAGATGQAIAGLASLAAVVLCYSGLALSWRRFTRKARPATS